MPRSLGELPRSSGEVLRWVFKLPRSDPKVPRSGLKVPRSVSVLPRFAAMHGFAFPCAMGVFIPVAAGWLLLSAFCRGTRFRVSSFDRAIYPPRREVPRHPLSRLRFMGVFIPVAAAPAHPRFAWARTVYPRCKRNAKSPQPPKVPRSLGLSIKILREVS